jgi:uncharacterized membrane protein YbhN (UPF0104 family)
VSRPSSALLIQLAVSLVLLALLVRRFPLHEAVASLGRLRSRTIVMCVALSLIGYWGRAQRWSLLLERVGVRVPAWTSYRLTLVGTFYGIVTPGRVGEFARILHVSAPRTATLSAAIWDRVADVLILEALCLPAFALVPAWRGPLLVAYLALVAATLVGVVVLGSPAALALVIRGVPALGAARLGANQPALAAGSGVQASAGARSLRVVLAAWLLRDLKAMRRGAARGLPSSAARQPPVALAAWACVNRPAAVFSQFGAGAATGAVFSLALFTVILVPASRLRRDAARRGASPPARAIATAPGPLVIPAQPVLDRARPGLRMHVATIGNRYLFGDTISTQVALRSCTASRSPGPTRARVPAADGVSFWWAARRTT